MSTSLPSFHCKYISLSKHVHHRREFSPALDSKFDAVTVKTIVLNAVKSMFGVVGTSAEVRCDDGGGAHY